MKPFMHSLNTFASAAALCIGAIQTAGAQGQMQAYMKRFMPICEHVVMAVSPGASPRPVCACTARRGFASIAADPQVAAAVLQGMQTYGQFQLTNLALTTPEQQQAAFSAMAALGAAYAACVAQPY